MKCAHKNRIPIAVHGRVVGAPSVGQCENESVPNLTVCGDHADREVLLLLIQQQQAELVKYEALVCGLEKWAQKYGKALCPPGADTYGNGIRDAKDQVRAILMKR